MVIKKGASEPKPQDETKVLEEIEETPKIVEVPKIAPKPVVVPKSPDSNSNFLAAASLFGSDQQAELDEDQKYTSKIA